jgi:hypothetical protein
MASNADSVEPAPFRGKKTERQGQLPDCTSARPTWITTWLSIAPAMQAALAGYARQPLALSMAAGFWVGSSMAIGPLELTAILPTSIRRCRNGR